MTDAIEGWSETYSRRISNPQEPDECFTLTSAEVEELRLLLSPTTKPLPQQAFGKLFGFTWSTAQRYRKEPPGDEIAYVLHTAHTVITLLEEYGYSYQQRMQWLQESHPYYQDHSPFDHICAGLGDVIVRDLQRFKDSFRNALTA